MSTDNNQSGFLATFKKLFLNGGDTLFILILSLYGSVYSSQISSCDNYNINLTPPNNVGIFYIGSGFTLLVMYFCFRYRTKKIDENEKQTNKLINLSDRLIDLVQKQPPISFVRQFSKAHAYILSVYDNFDRINFTMEQTNEDKEEIAKDMEGAIRDILATFCNLSYSYTKEDDINNQNTFVSNFMFLVEKSKLNENLDDKVSFRIPPCTRESIDKYLLLKSSLSSKKLKKEGSPQVEDMDSILLDIPSVHEQGIDHTWWVLPGAPYSSLTGRYSYIYNIERIDDFCYENISLRNLIENQDYKKFKEYMLKHIEKYRSFISIPIFSNKEIIGILNIYSNKNFFFHENPKQDLYINKDKVDNFILMLGPLLYLFGNVMFTYASSDFHLKDLEIKKKI